MFTKEVNAKVIGKTEEFEGWIFKNKIYKVALILNNDVSTVRKVRFDQYCMLETGKEYYITMYSTDNYSWYLSEEEAHYPYY
jgi:hypothetical protein